MKKTVLSVLTAAALPGTVLLSSCGDSTGHGAPPSGEAQSQADTRTPEGDGDREETEPAGGYCTDVEQVAIINYSLFSVPEVWQYPIEYFRPVEFSYLDDFITGAAEVWSEFSRVAPEEISGSAAQAMKRINDIHTKSFEEELKDGDVREFFVSPELAEIDAYTIEKCGADHSVRQRNPVEHYYPTGDGVLLDGEFSDEDGYRYRIVVDSPPELSYDINVADAKPGKALVSYKTRITGHIENLTPGRNAPVPPYPTIRQYLDESHPICGSWRAVNSDEGCFLSGELMVLTDPLPAGATVPFTAELGTEGGPDISAVHPNRFESGESTAESTISDLVDRSEWKVTVGYPAHSHGDTSFPEKCFSTSNLCD
ncbi:hypothetical protein [Corynebacterium pygosceleis]|uniref:Secreted protein n=1 Tax=Corynebacterium pygosceleis TaxID=2800406 RepID=A0A9Q4C815_9CORY|nr:hypothetical protein [Corynebacterium pygosceleis]MCK7637391.1 hypothetical protein [Corynebacterium pygosceleis]MCK7676041.1 hypothetical protein [Corynebacterium pygosceleis]MCX7445295.1 hypothetical protein [Corynebacterium pygosceleis]MCX7468280.1 hypothetical protein [Corynebacterium pygosceleis]